MKQILIGFSLLAFFFSCSTKKEKLVFEKREMTVSDPSDGWGGDVKLSIARILPTDSGKTISVLSTFKGKDLGFDITIPTENKKSEKGFRSGIIFSSSGNPSDNFLTALNEIYNIKMAENNFIKTISINFVDLHAMASKLTGKSNSDSDIKQYKLFFEDEIENAEIYLNIDEKDGWVELKEKDNEYRSPILKFLSQTK